MVADGDEIGVERLRLGFRGRFAAQHAQRVGGMAAKDYGGALEHYASAGFQLAYEAEVANGARVGYFDTKGALPAMIEVIEFLPATAKMFAGFREAARGWDGRNPVRPRT